MYIIFIIQLELNEEGNLVTVEDKIICKIDESIKNRYNLKPHSILKYKINDMEINKEYFIIIIIQKLL